MAKKKRGNENTEIYEPLWKKRLRRGRVDSRDINTQIKHDIASKVST